MVSRNLLVLGMCLLAWIFFPFPLAQKSRDLLIFLEFASQFEVGRQILDLLAAPLFRLPAFGVVLQLCHNLVEILVKDVVLAFIDSWRDLVIVDLHELIPDFIEDQGRHLRARGLVQQQPRGMLANEVPEVLREEGLHSCVRPLVRELALRRVRREHEPTSYGLYGKLICVGLVFVLFDQRLDVLFGVEGSPEDDLELSHHQKLAEERDITDQSDLLQWVVQLNHYTEKCW